MSAHQKRYTLGPSSLYPESPELEVAYAWAGTFGETKDGLADIGASPALPNAYFALGYGGNGITYSMIAAGIIADLYLGRENTDAQIFAFTREREAAQQTEHLKRVRSEGRSTGRKCGSVPRPSDWLRVCPEIK